MRIVIVRRVIKIMKIYYMMGDEGRRCIFL